MEKKRQRQAILQTIKQKVCKLKEKNSSLTIADIIKIILNEDKLKIGRATVNDILYAKEKWLNMDSDIISKSTCEQTGVHNELEDEALYIWINQMNNKNVVIN